MNARVQFICFVILFNVLIFPNLKNCGATPTTKGNAADMFKERRSPIPGPDPVNNVKLRGQATSDKKKKIKKQDGTIVKESAAQEEVIF
ncbi:hypothetical protein WDU94_010504 [Cyamophila willieti]